MIPLDLDAMEERDRRVVETIWRRWDSGQKLDVFAHATLVHETLFREWNGQHPVDENTTVRTYPAGTRVLVTMASRFGDFGVRANDIERIEHGYSCRLDPGQLRDFVPRWRAP